MKNLSDGRVWDRLLFFSITKYACEIEGYGLCEDSVLWNRELSRVVEMDIEKIKGGTSVIFGLLTEKFEDRILRIESAHKRRAFVHRAREWSRSWSHEYHLSRSLSIALGRYLDDMKLFIYPMKVVWRELMPDFGGTAALRRASLYVPLKQSFVFPLTMKNKQRGSLMMWPGNAELSNGDTVSIPEAMIIHHDMNKNAIPCKSLRRLCEDLLILKGYIYAPPGSRTDPHPLIEKHKDPVMAFFVKRLGNKHRGSFFGSEIIGTIKREIINELCVCLRICGKHYPDESSRLHINDLKRLIKEPCMRDWIPPLLNDITEKDGTVSLLTLRRTNH